MWSIKGYNWSKRGKNNLKNFSEIFIFLDEYKIINWIYLFWLITLEVKEFSENFNPINVASESSDNSKT